MTTDGNQNPPLRSTPESQSFPPPSESNQSKSPPEPAPWEPSQTVLLMRSWEPYYRLKMRDQPAIIALDLVLNLERDRGRVREISNAIRRSIPPLTSDTSDKPALRGVGRAIVGNLDLALNSAIELSRARARTRDVELIRRYAYRNLHVLNSTTRLSRKILESAINRALERDIEQDYELRRRLTRARELGNELAGAINLRTFDNAILQLSLSLDIAIDRSLASALQIGRSIAAPAKQSILDEDVLNTLKLYGSRERADFIALTALADSKRSSDLLDPEVLKAARTDFDGDRSDRGDANAAEEIDLLRSNFVGADLSDAVLEGILLDGVRWSPTTLWPASWKARIERDSVEIRPDLFEIKPGTADVSNEEELVFS